MDDIMAKDVPSSPVIAATTAEIDEVIDWVAHIRQASNLILEGGSHVANQ